MSGSGDRLLTDEEKADWLFDVFGWPDELLARVKAEIAAEREAS